MDSVIKLADSIMGQRLRCDYVLEEVTVQVNSKGKAASLQNRAQWLPKERSLKDYIYEDVKVPEQTWEGHPSHMTFGDLYEAILPTGEVPGCPVAL